MKLLQSSLEKMCTCPGGSGVRPIWQNFQVSKFNIVDFINVMQIKQNIKLIFIK